MSRNYGDANNIVNVSAIVLFQIQGITDRYIDFGNVVQVTGNLGVTRKQAEWSVNGILQLAKNVVIKVEPQFTIQCNEMTINTMYTLYGGTARSAMSQTLATALTLTITNAAPYDVARIPGENPTIVSVKQGVTSLVQGVDYDLVGSGTKASAIRFRSGSTFITGAQTIIITYNLPALAAGTFPQIWVADMFNQMNRYGKIEITFTDQYSNLFNHRILGNVFLSADKAPVYKPDDFASVELLASFSGAATLQHVET